MVKQLRELSPAERMALRLESVEGSLRELRGRQRELEESWQDFVPAVTNHLAKQIIIPGLIRGLAETIQLPTRLETELKDSLTLEDLPKRRKGKS